MRTLAAGAAATLATFLLAGAGCEAFVGRALPAFTCTPGDPNSCPTGQVCIEAGVCVGACPDTPCGADMRCNLTTRLCELTADGSADAEDGTVRDATNETAAEGGPPDAFQRGEVGSTCLTQANCNTGLICADSSVLTADVVKNTGPVCTRTCCSSEECPADFACYGPGTGGNYCVHASQLPRGSANGSKTGGSSCSTDAECRSGSCADANSTGKKRCADACCKDGPCPGGGVCGNATIETHVTMTCTEADGTVPAGGSCSTLACMNGLCLTGTVGPDVCVARCCGAASCSGGGTCGYMSRQGAQVQEYVPGCVGTGGGGSGKVGDSCTSSFDCVTSFCEPSTQTCTDVCCTDADCAAYRGYTACRPDTNPNKHYLICSPPS